MEKRILYDPHSPASACQSRVKHLHWTAIVDFQNKEIRASATWSIAINDSDQIAFDTRGLLVERVFTDDQENPFVSWGEENALLGRMLSIRITPDTHIVTIVYKTGPDAAALQWLNPEQTAGKKSSFLFTQSQAILARTWIPCQDSPGIRFTYSADISVPSSLMPLMSASNPVAINPSGFYHFEMDQPIPSYLMALAVGDLLFHPISKRSGIYAEPVSIQKAIWEFADLEKMITAAEELYGSYRWERYDLLVLPPSFPFGGMENPRLTFVTPTIISGDRSLISLVAHELAHSWSGNLVTNATWNDFWLNEGFTVYFETRIMEKLYGAEYAEMLMSLNLHDLLEEIESLNAGGNAADTKLKLKLEGRDPDDGVTEIAYNKGFFFLKAIEERTGRERFDIFIGDYFRDNAFKAMDTDTFIVYLQNYFKSKYDLPIGTEFLNSWIFTEGLPSPQPKVFSTRFSKVDVVADEWSQREGVGADTRSWSTHEWLHFLKRMPSSISISMMEKLDAFGGFTSTGNAEIMAEWGRLVIRHGYEKAYPAVEDFLIRTGRRKFLMPLYNEMAQTISGKQWAARVYVKARPNYHFVATSSIDKRLDFTG